MTSALKMLAAAVVCWMLAVPVQAADLSVGFLDARWASPSADQKGLSPVGSSGKINYYVNHQRAYKIYGTDVSEVVYGYYDDPLFAVYVEMEGIEAFSQIRSYVQHKYGVPKISRETRGDLTTYSWKVDDTRIKFKHYETSGRMKLSFYYMPIAGRVNLEMRLEGEEPPEPIFPLTGRRQREAIQQMELLSF